MKTLASTLDHGLVTHLLGPDMGHVAVPLRRLASARMLWLNHRAMHEDPQFARCGADAQRYARHLVESCAFQITPDARAADLVGYADRYGGGHIGFNGGSGRAAMVNGYHVKGIGRTPLVSALTSEGHASGGAYLEECVRETIYAEIVATEFPFSAVPTLAIIDTGLVQDWHTHLEPQSERRTLLVRPAFVRPAHFQRASGFQSGHPKGGALDTRRVQQVFDAAVEALGADGLVRHHEQVWDRWASQLAYGFVHRLPHGSDNTSNLALDGRLADFGAMSAVPSWAATATALQPERFAQRFGALAHGVRSMAYSFGRHFRQEMASEAAMKQRIERSLGLYRRTIVIEMLRVCGATASTAGDVVAASRDSHLWNCAARLIAHFQRELLDFVEATPEPVIPWDLDRLWDHSPPAHLREMRGVMNDLVPVAGRDEARQRSLSLSRSRTLLFKREMRTSIYRTVDTDRSLGAEADARRVAEVIERITSGSRRDFGG